MIPKFKAYIPSVKLMLPVRSINLEDKTVCCGNHAYGYDWLDYQYDIDNGRPADCVLLQSTGLFDKNNIEIFEGDILDFGSESDVSKGYVAFETGSFGKKDFSSEKAQGLFHWWNFCKLDHHPYIPEICGNIYQQ